MSKDKQVNENPSERRGSEQLHQAREGRERSSNQESNQEIGHTPDKAEGDEGDVDSALRNQR